MLMPLSRPQERVAAGHQVGEPGHHVPPREECGHAPSPGGEGGSRRRELSMGARWDGVGARRDGDRRVG